MTDRQPYGRPSDTRPIQRPELRLGPTAEEWAENELARAAEAVRARRSPVPQSGRRAAVSGLWFRVGVVLSIAMLAALAIVFRAGG